MRIGLALLALLACGVARAELSDAEKTDRARIHLKAAIAYYDDGRYEDASREMKAAYELKPLPDLQYNLAQCYERLGKLEDAANAYETYLRGASATPDRKNVEARIANLRERAKAEAAGQPPPPPVEKEKVVFKTIVVYREAPPPPGRGARWAAYGLSALAVAGLASGIAFAVLAAQAADDVTRGGNISAPPVFEGSIRDKQTTGETYPIISGVSFGVAGLSAAGAIALFLVAHKIDKEAPKVTLAPALSPTSAGFALAGSF
jgi:tetratricopeptide (TPR) repeat protein